MPVKPLPSDQLLDQLRVLFIALLFGQVLFGGVVAASLVLGDEPLPPFSVERTMLLILLLVAAVLFSTGYYVPRTMLKKLRGEKDDAKLYAGYRSVCLVRWAMYETATLLCITGAFLEHQLAYFIPASIALLLFALLYPTRDKMFAELQLGFKY